VRSPVIEVQGLGRRFGSVRAVVDLSFDVAPGEVVGLLGPNGAGKSTTLALLCGMLAPTSGRATVAGLDVLTHPVEVRSAVGVLPDEPPLYDDMQVEPYLRFVASVRGMGASAATRAVSRGLEQLGLVERRRQRIGTLSRGYRQRTALAAALLHDPPIVILDEPTHGLDPAQRAELRALIRAVGAERTVLLSSHDLAEVEAVCERVLVLRRGRLVADAAVGQLTRDRDERRVWLALGQGPVRIGEAEVVDELSALDGVRTVVAAAPGDDLVRVCVVTDGDRRAVLSGWASAGGHVLVELSEERTDLEQAFLRLTEER